MRLPALGAHLVFSTLLVMASASCTTRKPAVSPTESPDIAVDLPATNDDKPKPAAELPPIPLRLPCAPDDQIGCEKSCGEEYVEDCVTLGVMYVEGKSVDLDQARGIELFRKACDVESARGCLKLADLYHEGRLKDDPSEEAALYRKACDRGANQGCVSAGKAYLEGRIVSVDPSLAAILFGRVCERGNAEACLLLARLYEHGEGVRKDETRAFALYTKACQLGLDEGCLNASPTGEVLPPRF